MIRSSSILLCVIILAFCALNGYAQTAAPDIDPAILAAVNSDWRAGASRSAFALAPQTAGVTMTVTFVARAAVAPVTVIDQFYGNVLLVTTADISDLDNVNDPRVFQLQINWLPFIERDPGLPARLENSQRIAVTVDTESGAVSQLAILSYRSYQ